MKAKYEQEIKMRDTQIERLDSELLKFSTSQQPTNDIGGKEAYEYEK